MSLVKIEQIAAAAMAMEEEEAREAGALSYMARLMVQATLPHRMVAGNEFVRQNGKFVLSILSPSAIGLPYGTIPRLLLVWITTEVVRTRERVLLLGNRMSDFMRELELAPTGGRYGTIRRLKDQMRRLFASSITCTYNTDAGWALENIRVVDEAQLWWNPQAPDQMDLWESNLVLGERFWREIIEAPVPIDMRALRALRQSPLALDLYMWLSYRNSYSKKPSIIPWEAIQMQFGVGYPQTPEGKDHFKRKFIEALKKVVLVYEETRRVQPEKSGLLYVPGRPHVRRRL